MALASYRGDGRVRAGVVANNGGGFARDGALEKLSLFDRIVIVDQDERLIAERLGFFSSRIGEGFEERIFRRWHNDRDELVFRG